MLIKKITKVFNFAMHHMKLLFTVSNQHEKVKEGGIKKKLQLKTFNFVLLSI